MTEPTTRERVDRLAQAFSRFRADQPELAEALDILGLSVEEFEHGLAGYSTWPQLSVSTSSRPAEEEPSAGPASASARRR